MFDIFAYSEIKSVSADFRIKRNGEVLLINADDGTQSKYTFMEVTRRRYSQSVLDWFDEWREWQEELKLYDDKEYEEIGEGSLLCDDGPSGATDLVQG